MRISGPNVPDLPCELVRIDAGVLRVRCERRIADASPTTVSFDHIQLSGVVIGCRPIGDEWWISIGLVASRRHEARFPASGKMIVGIVGIGGTTSYEATVTDVSQSGLGLCVPQSIRLATRIYVETESEMIMGEVRHCHPTGDGQFILGVMIVEVVPDFRTQGKLAAVWGQFRQKLVSTVLGKHGFPR